MNAKLIIFSVVSLVLMAMCIVVNAIGIPVPCCFLCVFLILAVLFALLSVALVVADMIRQCKDESLLKSKAKLRAEIKALEVKKHELDLEILKLEARKDVYQQTDVPELKDKISALEAKNGELANQVGTYSEILAKLTRIETKVISMK